MKVIERNKMKLLYRMVPLMEPLGVQMWPGKS